MNSNFGNGTTAIFTQNGSEITQICVHPGISLWKNQFNIVSFEERHFFFDFFWCRLSMCMFFIVVFTFVLSSFGRNSISSCSKSKLMLQSPVINMIHANFHPYNEFIQNGEKKKRNKLHANK